MLSGIHDEEGAIAVPANGWCLALVQLSNAPSPRIYSPRLRWLVRANWGYGSTGTIPLRNETQKYLSALGNFAAGSQNVFGYLIGNEPNHENERPDGVYITPEHYADTFVRSYETLKAVDRRNRVIVGAIAPYHAQGAWKWTDYLREVLTQISSKVLPDGIAIHAYTRSMDPHDIDNEDKMGAPLQDTFSGFRTYQDALAQVPPSLQHLPVYLTEFNVLPQWEDKNTGVITAAYREIHWWNLQKGTQKIHCLLPYRWPQYDRWSIVDKPELQKDLQQAYSNNVEAPESFDTKVLIPSIKKDDKMSPSPSVAFQREIDERARDRGVSIVESPSAIWKVKRIEWFNEQEADRIGPDHHILFDTVDENGNRLTGVKVKVIWPTGFTTVTSEEKRGERWSTNFPMTSGKYSVMVEGESSEMVRGIEMGQDTPGGFNPGIHTSTEVVFQKTSGVVQVPESARPVLLAPVSGPISQRFGPSHIHYPNLKGHTGVDYAVPLNTEVVATAQGTVVESGNDPDGYGEYVKVIHSWGESLYAHLSQRSVPIGKVVQAGERVGFSGSTGNSTGPHLHFAIRVNPYNRSDGWDGFTDPLPYLTQETSVLPVIKAAAKEFNLEWELLASLAWAESSFGTENLFQIEDGAWGDFAPKVGATNRKDALDNARVAAAYLRWLLNYFDNHLWDALTAYNFGIGNVIEKRVVPQLTLTYVNKVIHGRDLLKAVGSGN